MSDKAAQWLKSYRLQILLVGLGVAAIALVVGFRADLGLQLKTGQREYDNTLVVAGFGAGFLLLLAGLLLHKLKSVSLPGGLSIELGNWTLDAAHAAREAGTDAGEDTPDQDGDPLITQRLAMEAKLAWMAKHFVDPQAGGGTAPLGYLTIGSLRIDGYLTGAQARTALRLTTMLPTTFGNERKLFVAAAKPFVDNLRASAVYHKTHAILKRICQAHNDEAGSAEAWRVCDNERRRRLIVYRGKHGPVTIQTVFPYPYLRPGPGRESLQKARLVEAVDVLRRRGPAFVVVPRKVPLDEDLARDMPRELPDGLDTVTVVYLDQVNVALIANA